MDDATVKIPETPAKKPGLLKKLVSWYIRQEKNGAPFALAFVLPFFVFVLCLALQGVYPFGDNQILNYDGWHQYYPFLMKLWDHVHQGQSLLYDWSMGMGTNFLSMLSYYGASPLNLILLLSPTRDFRLAYMFLVTVRIGLAGYFMAHLLDQLFPKRRSFALAFFGLGYALSGYLMGYYWNVMWLDSVALYPLLCLCTVLMLRKGKCWGYVFTLGLVLFSNYYIGYMCCVFTVLVFLALCFVDRVGWRGLWRRTLRFVMTSLLGGGLSAVLLLPAFYGLLNTTSTTGVSPTIPRFYESVRDLLAPLADFQVPAVMDGLPNLFCGALVAMLAFAFLWARKVRFREKLAGILIAAFLLVSMNLNLLNYFWHGFHFTNMIPYRFAFLFAFTLVVMAYGYLQKGVEGFDLFDAVGMFLFLGLLVWCAWGLADLKGMLVTVFLLAGCILLCALHGVKLVPRRVLSAAFCAVILVETGVGAYLGTQAVGTTSFSGYFNNQTGDEILQMVDQIKEWEADSTGFYRVEDTAWRSLNDSCFYNYNGISQFASSANVRASGFLQDLGLPADRGSNRFVYVHSTPLVNTLLGVKYLFHRDAELTDRELLCLYTPTKGGTVSLYENLGFSGLGFGVEEAAADFAFADGCLPYENQNALFRALTGLEGDLLIPLEATVEETENLTVERGDPGVWTATMNEDGEEDPVLRLKISVPQNGTVFVYANVPMANYVQMNNIWHALDGYPSFFSAGYFREGESFTLRAILRDMVPDAGAVSTLQAYSLNTALWQEGLARLRRDPMEITSMTETALSATITMTEDGYLYTSIPMERQGWTVLVDGEAAEITPFADAMVGLKLSAGEHSLSFRYTPEGFTAGWIISLVSLVLTIALFVLERRGWVPFREPPKPLPPVPEEPSPEEAP